MKNIDEKILGLIQKKNLIQENDRILIALSGGPDSVFCLNYFIKFQKKYKIEIAAIHINHNLRGQDSIRDEKFCKTLCEKLNVRLFSFSEKVFEFARKKKYSVEEAGRIIRYKLFDEVVKESNFNKLVTAHTMDDNTESIFLNIIKGSGVNGLAGISVKREYIIRPLLTISKVEILEYLKKNKWKFRTDKTNKSIDYQRNFFRLKILPLIRKINPLINQAIKKLSETSINIEQFLNITIEEIFIEHKNKFMNFEIPLDLLRYHNEFLQSELIRKFFVNILKLSFEYQDFIKLKKLAASQKGRSVSLKSGWEAIREADKLFFINKNVSNQSEKVCYLPNGNIDFGNKSIWIESVKKKEVVFNNHPFFAFIDADKIEGKLILRKWKSGDRFYPYGMNGSKKISDFLTDRKLNSSERKNVHVLADRNNIIWIVGLRISDKVRITEKTKNILKLTVVENEK